MRRGCAAALLLLLVAAVPLAAQQDSAAVTPGLPATPAVAAAPGITAARTGVEVWGGLAGSSQQLGILGEAPNMRFGIVALRWSHEFGGRARADEHPALEWNVDLVPVARLSPSLISLRGTGAPCATAALCVLTPPPSNSGGLFPPGAPFGLGFSPIGFTRRFHRRGPVSPFVGVNGGALLFDERVPTTKASRFNFTASAELGLRFGPPAEPGITVAYRFHHISNAGTAGENPGLASHLITVGVHRPRRPRGA